MHGPKELYRELKPMEKFIPVQKHLNVVEFGCNGGVVCQVLIDLFANYWNRTLEFVGIEQKDSAEEFRQNTEAAANRIVKSPNDPDEYSVILIDGYRYLDETAVDYTKVADIVIFCRSLHSDQGIPQIVQDSIPVGCLIVVVDTQKNFDLCLTPEMEELYTEPVNDNNYCYIYRKTPAKTE